MEQRCWERNIFIAQVEDNGNLVVGWEWGREKSLQGYFRYRDGKEEGEVRKKFYVFY